MKDYDVKVQVIAMVIVSVAAESQDDADDIAQECVEDTIQTMFNDELEFGTENGMVMGTTAPRISVALLP